MSTYKELLQTGREILKQQEIADADVDAWYLLAHVFKIKRTDLLLHGDYNTSGEDGKLYLELITERAKHIPLQHLTGTQEFMGLEYAVSEDVLIPRQDTETLVEEVLKVCKGKSVLDLCTGSGCIIISLTKLGNPSKAVGVDISRKALEVAAENAHRLQTEVEFCYSDLFDQVKGTYDIIVSNPPYIPTGEIADLMPEVKNHEPITALDGSVDGLYFYRRIISQLNNYLNKDGLVFFEIGHNQGQDVNQLLQEEGFTSIVIRKDLSGLDRVVSAKRS